MTRAAVALAAAGLAVAALSWEARVGAHLTAVSPYTFHRDVVPIVEARCGNCHADGNVSGLSLFRYPDARGASWRVRQVLVRDHMPPWFAEGAFKAPARLTARELNVLMTWATGGAPEGKPIDRASTGLKPSWPMGPPDAIVTMPEAFSFQGDQSEQVHEVSLPSLRIAGRLIRAVDLLAGTPAIVRRAEIVARSRRGDQVLGLWQPGETQAPLEAGAAFRATADSAILLRMHYRRQYGGPSSDRSQVGVYFATPKAVPAQTLEFGADRLHPQLLAVTSRMRLVAMRPISGPSGTRVRIVAIDASGARRQLATLRIKANWDRRYAFETPVTVAAGHTIEVSVTPTDSPLWTSLSGETVEPEASVRIALEFVK